MQQEIFDVQNDASIAIRNAEGTTLVSSVGYNLIYDSRNDPRNPTRGLYFDLSQDLAGVGGDVKYIRTQGDLRGYYPIRKKIVLAGRLQGGYIDGYGGQDVRILDLFFKGGETIRGFDTSGIGPRDLTPGTDNDALGGKIFAASTLELRFPLPKVPERFGLSAATFFDAATLYETGDLGPTPPAVIGDSSKIRTSVGVSLIWQSPLGPLRADFAKALTSEPYDDEKIFHFGAAARF